MYLLLGSALEVILVTVLMGHMSALLHVTLRQKFDDSQLMLASQ
jgi:hypothetical protein